MRSDHSNNIKISAIVPNYNSSEFLPKALESLTIQTEPFDEIIIVDDGSTDDSIAIINEFMQKHSNIRLVRHEKNQGVVPALNTGITHAIGDYVLLAAADDHYGQNIVELTKQVITQHPTVGLVCGDAIVTRFDLKEPFHRMLPYPTNTFISADVFKSISKRQYVGFNGGGGMFINRQLILEAGLIQNQARWHSDWLLYMIAALKCGMYYINEVFIHINMLKSGYSEGKNNRKIQNKVMLDTVNIIASRYPEHWHDFKEAALVPHYALRYIPLFLLDRNGRRFFSSRLVWKMFINNKIVVRIGRLFPYRVILGVRKLLRA